MKRTGRNALRACVLAAMLASSASMAEGFTLNMKDADLQAFITEVGHITGKTFILSPRVQGKVTIVSQHPMTQDEVYQVFLSTLSTQGFSAVDQDGVVKIVSDGEAKQDAVALVGSGNTPRTDEIVTRVFQLQNVSAQMLVPLIRPLVPQQSHLVAYQPTNMIIISDRAANVERVVRIINKIDVPGNDQDIEIVTLKQASAVELVRIMETLTRQAGQNMDGSPPPKFVADERTNSILLGGVRSERMRLKSLISRLDTPTANSGNTKVIYLRYASAKDMVAVLTGVGESGAKATATGGAPAGVPGGSSSSSRRSSSINQDMSIEAHEATNALVITAQPDVMKSLEAVIRQLDIRRAQVLVEAIIAEISEDKARELGVEWLFAPGGSRTVFPVGTLNSAGNLATIAGKALETASDPTVGAAAGLVGMTGSNLGIARFAETGVNFAALIHALNSDTNNNVLSTPSIMTLDNQEASIVVGQEVPFVTGSSTSNSNNGLNGPFQTIERKEVGVKLKITPQINEGNSVRLEIEQEVSGVAPSVAKASDVVTNKREIKTTVMVEDQQMVVLGGLIDEQVRESQTKVPLLGDIPLLGSLFKSNVTSKSKRNLVVFLRPSIIKDDLTLSNISDKKYSYIREEQLRLEKKGIYLMSGDSLPKLPQWDNSLALPPGYNEQGVQLKPVKTDAAIQPKAD